MESVQKEPKIALEVARISALRSRQYGGTCRRRANPSPTQGPSVLNSELWNLILDLYKDSLTGALPLLIESDYAKLAKVDPEHELLKYVTVEKDNVTIIDEFSEEFHRRFPPIDSDYGDRDNVYSLEAYHDALSEALKTYESGNNAARTLPGGDESEPGI